MKSIFFKLKNLLNLMKLLLGILELNKCLRKLVGEGTAFIIQLLNDLLKFLFFLSVF